MADIVATFDYTQLDEETRAFLLEKEEEMELVLRRTAYELGTILLEIKARLPHGQYMPWLASKGISQQTAHRWMQIAQGKAPLKSPKMSDLPQIAMEKGMPEIPSLTGYGYINRGYGMDGHFRAYKPVNGVLCALEPVYHCYCDWLWELEAIEDGRHPYADSIRGHWLKPVEEIRAWWSAKLDAMIARSHPIRSEDIATWGSLSVELKDGTVDIEQFSVLAFSLDFDRMIADGYTNLPGMYVHRCWEN